MTVNRRRIRKSKSRPNRLSPLPNRPRRLLRLPPQRMPLLVVRAAMFRFRAALKRLPLRLLRAASRNAARLNVASCSVAAVNRGRNENRSQATASETRRGSFFLVHANLDKTDASCFQRTATMHDEKRFIRKLRKQIKQAGNRKRRRYLKQIDREPGDFSYGRMRVDLLDAIYPDTKRRRSKPRDSQCDEIREG